MKTLVKYVIGGWSGKVSVDADPSEDKEAILKKARADLLARNPSLKNAPYEQWELLRPVGEAS